MLILRQAHELSSHTGGAFVPTMGALHEGHLALIRRASQCGSPVVVSIFVNPTQFGPNEDFARYPRTLDADVAAAGEAGANVVFAPEIDTVYPPNSPQHMPRLPEVATKPALEDAFRPGHLAGVCQVVARLFDLVQPRSAFFGEKDYQQLQVVRSLVTQEGGRWPGLQIVAHPTVRDPDGLAMSSRNRYLNRADRQRALSISRALTAAQSARDPSNAEKAMHDLMQQHGLAVDYAVVRNAESLLPLTSPAEPARALIAARLATVRLIDNAAWTGQR